MNIKTVSVSVIAVFVLFIAPAMLRFQIDASIESNTGVRVDEYNSLRYSQD